MTTDFHQSSAGSVCATCTVFVAIEPSSRGHLKSRFVMTRTGIRCAMMNSGMCGRAITMVGRLQSRF